MILYLGNNALRNSLHFRKSSALNLSIKKHIRYVKLKLQNKECLNVTKSIYIYISF